MPKRTRGTSRPGQRRPIQRPAVRPTTSSAGAVAPPATEIPVRRAGVLTPDEEARAAELEAKIVAEERAAEANQRRTRQRVRDSELIGGRTRDVAPLAVRASAEYAYVRRDIYRIARIALLLLLVVAILHVLINVLGVITI